MVSLESAAAPSGGSGSERPLARDARDAHRLETLGRLSPAIAHEISTPAQFMGDSLSFLATALEGYARVHQAYEALARDAEAHLPDAVARARAVATEVDVPFLDERTPRALSRIESGITRIAAASRALSALSGPECLSHDATDVQGALEHALALLSSTVRHVATVETAVSTLPAVPVSARDLGDVLLNVLLNAVEAVAQAGHRAKTGLVRVAGSWDGERVVLHVSDNGVGVATNIGSRVFDAGYTTKPGRSGRGLVIVRDVLRHAGGSVDLVPAHTGAHFRLTLPAGPAARRSGS